MKEDRRRRDATAGEDVERLMSRHLSLPRKACRMMREWYRAMANPDPPTSGITLKWIMAERVKIYRSVPPR